VPCHSSIIPRLYLRRQYAARKPVSDPSTPKSPLVGTAGIVSNCWTRIEA
jgi:hypothetical protein